MKSRFETTEITRKYHDAIVDWQEKNFADLKILTDHWERIYPGQTPFRLVAKVAKLRSEEIEVGNFKGQKRYEKAGDMRGNMFYAARDIIRAQCSTELGSIQQHRLSLDGAINEEAQFGVLRIMAEELRHAYQMFWVLDADPSWRKMGMGDVAEETIQELLSMETGGHVLDAFNIEFNDFLDNVMFGAVIDLVGKYQLRMQKVFSYAPMARSMTPMLSEEGFHLATGRRFAKEIALQGAQGKGDFSVEDVQKALNLWLPRGLEMFGSETAGTTVVYFGFKDMVNADAQAEYLEEVRGLVQDFNMALVEVYIPGIERPEAREIVRKVIDERVTEKGVRPEMLISVPDKKFFRRRGLEEYAYQPFDFDGKLITEGGKAISPDGYIRYLEGVLPEKYVRGREFGTYKDALRDFHARESRVYSQN